MREPYWLSGGETRLAISQDAPTLWMVSLDDPAARRRAEAVAVSAADLAAVATHVDAGERLLRRRLAILMLANADGCPADTVLIDHGAEGAPIVTRPAGWCISVAARWPDCVIGIARAPLGVDIERATKEPPALDLLTFAEGDRLMALSVEERPSAFAACWAAKEAHSKWTGQPRRLDPATIDTDITGIVSSPLGTSRCWRRTDGALVVAVCTA